MYMYISLSTLKCHFVVNTWNGNHLSDGGGNHLKVWPVMALSMTSAKQLVFIFMAPPLQTALCWRNKRMFVNALWQVKNVVCNNLFSDNPHRTVNYVASRQQIHLCMPASAAEGSSAWHPEKKIVHIPTQKSDSGYNFTGRKNIKISLRG